MSEDIMRYRGRYLSLLERDGWEFASRSNASGVVVIIAVTDGGEIVLVITTVFTGHSTPLCIIGICQL